jgi:hypothetical protein
LGDLVRIAFHGPLRPSLQHTFQEKTMKNLRQFCTAFVLTLALTISASAGWVTTGITDTPPSPLPSEPTADDNMSTPVAGQIETTHGVANLNDPVTQLTQNLLQSLLSLF